ncbi:MAG: hypothetical protein F4W89_01480 [Acidobacteria bacterium]|nr:hypothetical protein [Acidobacteriota bacterium]
MAPIAHRHVTKTADAGRRSHPEHLHYLVTEVVDDLDGDEGDLVRFPVGIKAAEDLIANLDQAFDRL